MSLLVAVTVLGLVDQGAVGAHGDSLIYVYDAPTSASTASANTRGDTSAPTAPPTSCRGLARTFRPVGVPQSP
jgi:hypothetical protein